MPKRHRLLPWPSHPPPPRAAPTDIGGLHFEADPLRPQLWLLCRLLLLLQEGPCVQVALLLWVRRRARRHRAAAAGGQRTAARLACTAAAPVPAAPEAAATGTAAGRRGAGGEAARPVCKWRAASARPHARRRNRTAAPTAQATQSQQSGHGSSPGGLLGQAEKRCARQERGPPQLPCCHHGATQQQLLGQAIEPNFVRWPIASAQEGQGLDAQARTQTPPLLVTDSAGGASLFRALGAVFWQPAMELLMHD